jgi:hypothetical protein
MEKGRRNYEMKRCRKNGKKRLKIRQQYRRNELKR